VCPEANRVKAAAVVAQEVEVHRAESTRARLAEREAAEEVEEGVETVAVQLAAVAADG